MTEFYITVYLPDNARILHEICPPKSFFPEIGEARAPLPPSCYAYEWSWSIYFAE